jgi:hypothetical protein
MTNITKLQEIGMWIFIAMFIVPGILFLTAPSSVLASATLNAPSPEDLVPPVATGGGSAGGNTTATATVIVIPNPALKNAPVSVSKPADVSSQTNKPSEASAPKSNKVLQKTNQPIITAALSAGQGFINYFKNFGKWIAGFFFK